MEHPDEQADLAKDPTLIERIGEAIIVPLMLAIIAVGFAAVILRYVFNGHYALFWSEELIRYAFIWVFWLCAPILVWRRTMFTVDIFLDMMPGWLSRTISIALDCGVMFLMAVFLYYGWSMAVVNEGQLSSALSLPLFWIYLAIPVGSALVIFATLCRILKDFRKRSEGLAR